MDKPKVYNAQEGVLLLKLARHTLEQATQRNRAALEGGALLASFVPSSFDPALADSFVASFTDSFVVSCGALPPALQAQGACFVTLLRREDGRLRGCTGTLLPRQALAAEVVYSTVNTALNDPRFEPVRTAEVAGLQIEISILSDPQPLKYKNAAELLKKLRPHVDGVTLSLGAARGTFLPQVWERYPNPDHFLSALCHKMSFPPEAWQTERFKVETYQAQKFIE